MSLSRRHFFHASSAALLAPYVSGRGLESLTSWTTHGMRVPPALAPTDIRLNSNENPNGCAPETMQAIAAAMSESNRYPRSSLSMLSDALAASFNIKPENIVLGCGSTDVLRASVYAWCGRDRALVTAAPSFENPAEDAKRIGAEVRSVPVTGDLRIDLDAMAIAARGAGLVYLCNPNNPTSTVHGAEAVTLFVSRVMRESPSTTILVDEAYHEYVDDPRYATAIPVALANPRVFVARTFSKVHGMAGMRIGYAIGTPQTMKELSPLVLAQGVNQLAAFGAISALGLREHVALEARKNREARAFTVKGFTDMGFAVAESNANFIMANLRHDSQPFRDACKKDGVLVGRPFPPLDTWVRISIGTNDEMARAVPVFRRALSTA